MGTLLLSEATKSATNSHNELESEFFLLNYNSNERNSMNPSKPKCKLQMVQRKCKCGTVSLIASGLCFLALGLLAQRFTFTDFLLTEKLKMKSWLPCYDVWLNPDIELRLKIYIFTAENANEFLSGADSKIKLKEIGPVVYREYISHRDIVYHANSTLSYSTYRWAEFLPHANEPGILNKTITVPNFPALAAAGFLNERNYLMQIAYNFLHRSYNTGLFINITVYDFLWNNKIRLLEKAQEFSPSMVPTTNAGFLDRFYAEDHVRFNVKIGTKYGDSEFFKINTINGASTAPGFNVRNGDCNASVANSSEGSMYRQRITKDNVLSHWAMCQSIDMHFAEQTQIDGISAFKYIVRPDVHDRKPIPETDCFKGVYRDLQNGLSDISKCFFDVPLAISLPHFYGRSDGFTKKFEGLNASEENHSSFSIIEPKLGLPLSQVIRSQGNLVIPKFSSLIGRDYQVFSDMVLPLLWIEFIQMDMTPQVHLFVDLIVNVFPFIEMALACTLFLVGFSLILTALVKKFNSKWNLLSESKQMNFSFVQRRIKSGSNV